MNTDKTKMGRKPHDPSDNIRKQIKMLSGMGVPDYDIVRVLGLSEPTMCNY